MKLSLNSRIFSRKYLNFFFFVKSLILFVIVVAFGLLIYSGDGIRYKNTLGSKNTSKLDKIYLQEGIRLYELGRFEESKRNIEAALEINPLNVEVIDVYQRFIESDLENLDAEIVKTKEVLSKRPDYATAWLKLSILYKQIGENEMSETARVEAIRLNPNLN